MFMPKCLWQNGENAAKQIGMEEGAQFLSYSLIYALPTLPSSLDVHDP
jgi:hypothetical protein